MIRLFNVLMTTLVVFFGLRIIADLVFNNKNSNKKSNKKVYFAIAIISFLSFFFFVTIGKFEVKSTLPFLIVASMSLAEVFRSYEPATRKEENFKLEKLVVRQELLNPHFGTYKENSKSTSWIGGSQEEIYFQNIKDQGKVYKATSSGDRIKLCEDVPSNINIFKNYIYYTNNSENGLIKLDTKGNNRKKIIKDEISRFMIFDDYIYYIDSLEGKLFRVDLEGLHSKKLCDMECTAFNFAESKIIVLEKGTDSLYSISLFEENEIEDLEQKTKEFSVTTNEIYFTEGTDNYTLYRYNLSNKKVEKITDEKMIGFILLDEFIFYSNLTDKLKLYCYSLRDNKAIKLSDHLAKGIQVVGDNIYYHDSKNDFKLNLYDGKSERLLKPGEI